MREVLLLVLLGEGLLCLPNPPPYLPDPGQPANLWEGYGWGLVRAPEFSSSCYRQGTVQGAFPGVPQVLIPTLMGYHGHFRAMTQEGWG